MLPKSRPGNNHMAKENASHSSEERHYFSTESRKKILKRYPILRSFLSLPELTPDNPKEYLKQFNSLDLRLVEIYEILEKEVDRGWQENFAVYTIETLADGFNQGIFKANKFLYPLEILVIESAFFSGFEIGNQKEIEYFLPEFVDNAKDVGILWSNDQNEYQNINLHTGKIFREIMEKGASLRLENPRLNEIFPILQDKEENLSLFRNFLNSLDF
ncbi:hypothetical protein COT63_00150 [Candidatus Shapirobacteria bacterium CG09_land_8_20_14_0_10_38_17]|uniref:Uncharacterized protein n=1 Tax=Candidatus Shapirobacteria bacterium CG09_land_8_20_14_0_10_38_17 TaxID=1974884 RepID=A0A2H0WRW8_9BACT|nr:MAG: hypothetical protein COT63_00150 [Candidatus Shapirobacteria bacterium CG09_land_8_20_14_0_10_38_17]